MENDKELRIRRSDVINSYKNTDESGKGLLEDLFGVELFKPKDIRERVKTYEDACEVLGIEPSDFCGMRFVDVDADGKMKSDSVLKFMPDEIAYFKLKVITKALNEGWKPKFDGNEVRYYPWFWIYTKKEYEALNAKDKKECRVVGRSYLYAGALGGVACAHADNASSLSSTYGGSRLAFKTRELAEYCGKQFLDIWVDFLI